MLTEQPSLQSFVQRIGNELSAKAIVLLHEDGRVLHRYGWIDDANYPPMAALVVAMIAAGKSLGKLGESFPENPSRFTCDSDAIGLYTVAVTKEIWLAVLYEQPLNPGLFRMKVRRYSELLARLEVKPPAQWEITESKAYTGAIVHPALSKNAVATELITPFKSTLFADISDEEIDELFENTRS